MKIIIIDVFGKEYILEMPSSVALSEVKQNFQATYGYYVKNCGFFLKKFELKDNSTLKETMIKDNEKIVMIDYSLFPTQDFPSHPGGMELHGPKFEQFLAEIPLQRQERFRPVRNRYYMQ